VKAKAQGAQTFFLSRAVVVRFCFSMLARSARAAAARLR